MACWASANINELTKSLKAELAFFYEYGSTQVEQCAEVSNIGQTNPF